jgi:hypothetical protein
MATLSLSKSSCPHFLVFPTLNQVYCWRVVDERDPAVTVSRHTELEFAQLKADQLNKLYAKRTPILQQCAWEEPFQDSGFLCYETGTVHHLELEQTYCLKHFRMVEVGR